MIYIIATCPLRHEHCVPMKPSFRAWLKEREQLVEAAFEDAPPHTTDLSFGLNKCPWGVELEASSRDSCPHCGQQLRNGRFCCAFPLEDEDE